MRILVGISGGVDSAITAYLLQQQGHQVVGGFMLNYLDETNPGCTTKQDLTSFYEVCEWLKIPFEVLDFREEYSNKVLKYLYEGYLSGITPNPDILCNSKIKFTLFLQEAISMGYEMIATGHYARIISTHKSSGPTYHLLTGSDTTKDQSYFLSGLNQYQLSKALFPLGDITKSQVRSLARKIGLPNADRKDSQGLCFVGDVPMSKLLQEKIGVKPGNIILTDGTVVGTHTGAYQYTIGQRKGIGLHIQCYVVDRDIIGNTVIVSTDMTDPLLYRSTFLIRSPHWIGDPPALPVRAWCKVRYRQSLQPCLIQSIHNQSLLITTDSPQKGVPNGQICVIYGGINNQEVLGSGEIGS